MTFKNSFATHTKRFRIASFFLPLFLLHQLCLCLFLCEVLHLHPEDESSGNAVSFHSGLLNSLPSQEDCQLGRCLQNNLTPPESGVCGKKNGQSLVGSDFLPPDFIALIRIPFIVEHTGRIHVPRKLYLLKHALLC